MKGLIVGATLLGLALTGCAVPSSSPAPVITVAPSPTEEALIAPDVPKGGEYDKAAAKELTEAWYYYDKSSHAKVCRNFFANPEEVFRIWNEDKTGLILNWTTFNQTFSYLCQEYKTNG